MDTIIPIKALALVQYIDMTRYVTVSGAVCEKVKKLLEEKSWSIHKLSIESSVNYSTLKKLLSNQNNGIEFGTVIQIASGFGVTLAEFVNDPIFSEDSLKFEVQVKSNSNKVD